MSQQNKTTLQSAINTQLADNTSGDISAADVRDNMINMTDSLVFNNGSSVITGSLGITGSLTQQNGDIAFGVADIFGNRNINVFFNSSNEYVTLGAGNSSSKPNRLQLYSQTGVAQLIAANDILLSSPTVTVSSSMLVEKGITGSLQGTATTASYALTASMLLGSVTSASYASTSSLSNTTIGAGVYGGEIQFKGSIGLGGTGGKNTYSSVFTWNDIYSGLNIGDTLTGGTGNYYIALGTDAQAYGNYTIAFGSSSYANSEGSFSHGKSVTANGDYSHAEGYNTTANGDYSHAEGLNNTSTGNYSHAEGNANGAVGNGSHAEGFNNTSEGVFSHAEGNSTYTLGDYSHAEGNSTQALGDFSHAEGTSTVSTGTGSHAEGIGTIAAGDYQHASGKYNVSSTSTDDLFIIGNGTQSARRDAFKVRMSGSIILPTTQSAAPSWTGTNGEMVFATVTGNHYFYVWMGGAWRSGSLS
jgi:hypothetical protein